jgi:hypothetical protein
VATVKGLNWMNTRGLDRCESTKKSQRSLECCVRRDWPVSDGNLVLHPFPRESLSPRLLLKSLYVKVSFPFRPFARKIELQHAFCSTTDS